MYLCVQSFCAFDTLTKFFLWSCSTPHHIGKLKFRKDKKLDLKKEKKKRKKKKALFESCARDLGTIPSCTFPCRFRALEETNLLLHPSKSHLSEWAWNNWSQWGRKKGEKKKKKCNLKATLTQRATHLCAHTCESSVAFSYETPFHSLDGYTTKYCQDTK